MEFVRIGDKVISPAKVMKAVEDILERRARGWSQHDVAKALGIDRSFVSRLEGLGEVRRGKRIALIGFPVKNKDEVRQVAEREGVEFILLLSEQERWEFVRARSGAELFNEVLEIIMRIRGFDTVVFLGSDKRVELVRAIVGKEVIGIEIGQSPITEDKYVDPAMLAEVLRSVRFQSGPPFAKRGGGEAT